jgi:hypothetical protein
LIKFKFIRHLLKIRLLCELSCMNKLIRRSCLLLLSLSFAYPCVGEELEPRSWAHLPIDKNFIGSGYAYTTADIDFDPILKIEDGQVELHTLLVKYLRTFELFDKSARVDVVQAHQDGRWFGLLDGQATTVNRRGWTDTTVRFAINLYGAPALAGKNFADYRAAAKDETIIGVGLKVQLPTGEYMSDKLINLGSNRYTFTPQIGAVRASGPWWAEATGMVAIYTDNDEFYNGNKLEQDPLYIIHSHLVYSFRPGTWAGVSAGYNHGGKSTLNGIKKDDQRQNVLWAISAGMPLTPRLAIKFAYANTRTREDTGIDSETFAIGLSGAW